jgi:DNA polymerase-1
LRAAGEREAFNYLIQGSEADLMKMAMLCIHRCPKLRGLGVRMALQVHDELVLFIPVDSVEEATPLIEEYVSHPYRHFGFRDLKVDTPAELGTAENWAEAKLWAR